MYTVHDLKLYEQENLCCMLACVLQVDDASMLTDNINTQSL